MAIRQIVTVDEDNPVLRQTCSPVEKVNGTVQTLIDDMVETMRGAPGMGLAAPQVDVSLRVIVVEIPEEIEDPSAGKMYALCNPEIIRTSREIEEGQEGCLSVPDYVGLVDRHVSVVVKGLNRNGRKTRVKASGLLARVLQHEIDHLDGILFIDRLTGPDKLFRVEDLEPEETEPAQMPMS